MKALVLRPCEHDCWPLLSWPWDRRDLGSGTEWTYAHLHRCIHCYRLAFGVTRWYWFWSVPTELLEPWTVVPGRNASIFAII